MALPSPTKPEQIMIIQKLCHDNVIQNESRYITFVKHYKSTVCVESVVTPSKPAFQTHQELLDSLETIILDPTKIRDDLQTGLFPKMTNEEKDRGIRNILRVAFMVDCDAKDDYSGGYKIGSYSPVKWEHNETFVKFLKTAFPISSNSHFHQLENKGRLKGWKLAKRYGIIILPTDDLCHHLLFDREARTLKIFHQVAFLKAQLSHTLKKKYDTEFENSIKA
jgi:hypothetical protein